MRFTSERCHYDKGVQQDPVCVAALGTNRRGAFRAALVAGLVLATGLSFSLSHTSVAVAQDEPLDVTFIILSAPHVFWNPTLRGVEDAAKMFNVNVDVQYANSDLVTQNNILETAITNHVDGIALALFAKDAFTENVQRARDAGIAVVAFNADDSTTARQAYIGATPHSAGYAIGKRMVKACGLGTGDKVFTPAEWPEEPEMANRLAGVKQAIDEVGAVAEGLGTGPSFDEALEKMTQYLIGHQDTKCVISLGGTPTAVAAQAIAESGVKVPNGGFDLNDLILDNLKAGTLEATIDQVPYMQGFLPIMQIAYFVRYGISPADVDTGLAIVDSSNVDVVSKYVGTYR